MAAEACITKQPKGLSIFERCLTVWVILCILGGTVLGKLAPGRARSASATRSSAPRSPC
jgi:ACR3 family arsenite transporter